MFRWTIWGINIIYYLSCSPHWKFCNNTLNSCESYRTSRKETSSCKSTQARRTLCSHQWLLTIVCVCVCVCVYCSYTHLSSSVKLQLWGLFSLYMMPVGFELFVQIWWWRWRWQRWCWWWCRHAQRYQRAWWWTLVFWRTFWHVTV